MSTPRRLSLLDLFLVALVLAFAFGCASFAVRNSDCFRHLASGRLLASGQYRFGADPFSYTTAGLTWANHAWLFDLGLYLIHQATGGTGVVVIKALLVALLAGLLLAFRTPGAPTWPAALATLLALLVMAPRLLVQPAALSLLLLALTLFALWKRGRLVYAIPALIVLWVNVDAWFLLGVAVVGLAWVMERFSPPDAETTRLPNWLLPACLIACLLSPHHIWAIRLPDELQPGVWRSELRNDPRFAGYFTTPWQLGPLTAAGGYSLTAYAFFALLGLSASSFLVHRPALRDWRLPVYLLFVALAAWQTRLGGFFAVVAAIVTSLNLAQALPAGAGPRWPRVGLALASVALLALCWPGWLSGFHRPARPLAWEIQPDPTLVNAATTLADWRSQGVLPSGTHAFATHPDAGNYLPWFAPGEKTFLDSRLSLFLHVVPDYQELSNTIEAASRRDNAARGSSFAELVRDHHIAAILCTDPDFGGLGGPLRLAAFTPARWPILGVPGQAVVLGIGPRISPPVSFDALAFRVVRDSPLRPAPAAGVDRLAPAPPWWAKAIDRPSGTSWQAGAAAVFLRLHEESRPSQQRRQEAISRSRQAAGLIGALALPGDPAGGATTLASRLGLGRMFLLDLNERPSELPLLAIRAARHAVALHPDDPRAWLMLGQAYIDLGRTSVEASDHATLTPLIMIRHIQAVTALRQALVLDPALMPAHEALALIFAQRNYLDLVLYHRDRLLELSRAAGPLPNEDRTRFDDRIEGLRKQVDTLRRTAEDQENRFSIRTQSLAGDPLARARIALELGLAGMALDDVLLKSSVLLFGADGARQQLELLLLTGRAEEARQQLQDIGDNASRLGLVELPTGIGPVPHRFGAFEWFSLCIDAALGRYARANLRLDQMANERQKELDAVRPRLTSILGAVVATEVGMASHHELLGGRAAAFLDRLRADIIWQQHRFAEAEQPMFYVLAGMLDLERGEVGDARQQFDRAARAYQKQDFDHPARALLNHYLARLQEAAQ